jgi:hypothetical protein
MRSRLFFDGKFFYISKSLYCDIRAESTEDLKLRTTHIKLFGSFVYEFEGEPNLTCLSWLDPHNKKDVEVMIVTPPGRRPWNQSARERCADSVKEDANEVIRMLLADTALYCVRVTLQIGGRLLRPVHFIYDCLSRNKFDRDNAVTVELVVIDSNIELYVNYGKSFGQFMVARGSSGDHPASSTSTHVGAWSLVSSIARTSLSTPAAFNREASSGLRSRWSMRRPALREKAPRM